MFFPKKLRVLAMFSLGLLLSGCAENPGKWPKEKVAEKVKESLRLTDITLNEKAGGGFEGSGKLADGETLTFTVDQDPSAGRISWDSKGDRGSNETGWFELK